MTSGPPRSRRLAVAGALLLATGCDPILNLYGSFFPAWIVCLLAGVVLATLLRFVFAATGLDVGGGVDAVAAAHSTSHHCAHVLSACA